MLDKERKVDPNALKSQGKEKGIYQPTCALVSKLSIMNH